MLSCPNCGGNLKFQISSQKLNCEYCSSQFDPYEFDSKMEDDSYDVTVFTCSQCGGEIVSTDTTAASFCSFCGASTILYSRIRKENRPDFVLPFTKTKEDCKQAYLQKMKRAWFAPAVLKDESCIDSFRGIYIPYWGYDIVQEGEVNLIGTKEYRSGDYMITEQYQLSGELNASYEGIYYDASASFDDTISEKIAPFDTSKRKRFTPSFLSGFYADVADVDSKVYQGEAQAKAFQDSFRQIKNVSVFQNYQIGTEKGNTVPEAKVKDVRRMMYPVWFLSYRKKDRVIYATVNGQTGKVVADIPIDVKKYLLGSFLLAIPLFFLFNLLFVLKPFTALLTTSILSGILLALCIQEYCEIKQKEVQEQKPKVIGFFCAILSLLLSAVVLLLRPVSDWYYYGVAILCLLSLVGSVATLIQNYNLLSTHRLPQFDRQGGDDRA